MKQLLIISLVLLSTIVQAKNFYISSSGNDANNGLSAASPWKTIAKLNASFAGVAPGDSILFKKNETFYGSIIVGAAGTTALPIVFGAYGSGTKPIISGFTKLTSWTNSGGGIWKTTVTNANINFKLVTINNKLQRMGRYPNFDAPNGGYLSYESWDWVAPSITDDQLPASPNWTGADAVIRKYSWVIDVCKITAHNGSTLAYTNSTGLFGENGNGYFIQNDLRTLDQMGEWYLNPTTKDLSVYFGSNSPTAYNIKASVVDTVFNFRDLEVPIDNVILDGLAVEGANTRGLFAQNSTNITVKNCLFNNNYNGIYMWNVTNSITDNNTVTNTLNNGIIQYGQGVSPTTIKNNTVRVCGLFAGMGDSGAGAYSGVQQTGDNTTIDYNKLDSIGYNGIKFYGSNIKVRNNFVKNFCSVLDDGAGIYTYQNNAGVRNYVQKNIVTNGIGARAGRFFSEAMTQGIYMDNDTRNISILDNTVSDIDGNGMLLNTPQNQLISGNTLYNVDAGIQPQRYPNTAANPAALVRNMTITKNIVYPRVNDFVYWNGQLNEPVATDIQTDMRAIGRLDSNYYRKDLIKPFQYYYHVAKDGAFVYPAAISLDGWKQFMNSEVHSKSIPIPQAFVINSIIGSNKKLNSGFNTDLSNYYITVQNTASVWNWDNTGKITGNGSVKITPNAVSLEYTSLFGSVGAIAEGKTYLLKFKSLSTTGSCAIRANLRQTESPYATLVPEQTDFATNTITQHQFLIAGVNEADASVLIDIQLSGTVYIDDVEFYEADATMQDVNGLVRFEYNSTKTSKTIALGANYIGVDSTQYSGSITLAPFTSKILLRDISSTSKIVSANDVLKKMPVTTALKTSIYPNPAITAFNLRVEGGTTANISVDVLGFDGKVLYKTIGASNQTYSFGKNFKPGFYTVVVTQGKTIQTLKLVKGSK